MNTPEPYERHLHRTLPEPPPTPEPEKAAEALAVHRDPSLPAKAAAAEPDRAHPTLAWVRPSELPTLVGAPWVRRGIDLQAELTRRARRTPRAVAARAGRITRTAIAAPEPSTPTATSSQELGL